MMKAVTSGPLQGIRVVEAGSLIAGPYSGQLLGDLGAEILKIEDPGKGDAFRSWGLQTESKDAVWWAQQSRNKKSVTLNLRTETGREVFLELLGSTDVLIENFRPGTFARWGIGPDYLQERFPSLVISQVSGFGQTGPYAQRPGYASIGEAMAGLRHITGYPDRPPVRVGLSLGDSLAGIFSTIGILAALYDREQSGLGERIDTSIYESVLALTESLVSEAHQFGVDREPSGPSLRGIAPSNAYPTRDGSSLIIAANQDTVFARLCEAMGQPELATDPLFADHNSRGENAEELDALIAEWSLGFDIDELLQHLENYSVPAGRINRASDILQDPQVTARESVTYLDSPRIGDVAMPNVMPRLTRNPGSIRQPAPDLGAHTDEVLTRVLHYNQARLRELRAEGVV